METKFTIPRPTVPDAGAYLARIGLQDAGEPDKKGLDRLVYAHQCTVPFEDLDCCVLHRPISLNTEHLFEKIVTRRRGGYCFEMNGLFCALLSSLGFDAVTVPCRVAVSETLRPVRHRGVLVTLPEGRFFCDVGFGGAMAPFAVPLTGERITQGGETFWVENAPDRGWFVLRRLTGSGLLDESTERIEKNVVVFGDTAMTDEDFEPYSYFCYAMPGTRFTEVRMANLRTPDGFISLTGSTLTERKGSAVTRAEIPEGEILPLLKERFGIEL